MDHGGTALPANPFQERNGVMYHYLDALVQPPPAFDTYVPVRTPMMRFTDITQRIRSGWYTKRGFYHLRLYCPYKSVDNFDGRDFRGVPSVDFFDTDEVRNGSLEEFSEMTWAANDAGIAVSMYISLLFVHEDSVHLSGHPEVFRVNGRAPNDSLVPTDTLDEARYPFPTRNSSRQRLATSWGFPALDYSKQETREFARQVLTFWMDRGVDGFEFDSPGGTLGLDLTDATDIFIDHPMSHSGRSKWLAAESELADYDNPFSDRIGFTHLLLNGDDDVSSLVSDIFNGAAGVDTLEERFSSVLDSRRAVGRGAWTWSLYDPSLSGEQRALDAAVHAGNGVLYSIDYEAIYDRLSTRQQSLYDEVFATIAKTSALAPGASRARVPTRARGAKHYAVIRTSVDGADSAVGVFNFASTQASISLDLNGLGVPSQTPTDLRTDTAAAPIVGPTYTVVLPAYGYLFLQVSRD